MICQENHLFNTQSQYIEFMQQQKFNRKQTTPKHLSISHRSTKIKTNNIGIKQFRNNKFYVKMVDIVFEK